MSIVVCIWYLILIEYYTTFFIHYKQFTQWMIVEWNVVYSVSVLTNFSGDIKHPNIIIMNKSRIFFFFQIATECLFFTLTMINHFMAYYLVQVYLTVDSLMLALSLSLYILAFLLSSLHSLHAIKLSKSSFWLCVRMRV